MSETLPLIARAFGFGERTALVDDRGTSSYRGLLATSADVAARLLGARADLDGARVAFLVPPSIALQFCDGQEGKHW